MKVIDVCRSLQESPTKVANISVLKKFVISLIPAALSLGVLSADMFESVNKKTLIHPLHKVGFFNSKRTP